MKVLVACEYSGTVRDAFIARGHDAMSCDLLPTDKPGPHYQGDVRDVLDYPWDLAICHPPCTALSVSGSRHFSAKRMDGRQQAGASFFMLFTKTSIPKWCIENPVSIMSSIYRKPDQVIQPWWFGDDASKKTCLWLKGLPKLELYLPKVIAPQQWRKVMAAADMVECECCGEPFCPECNDHYADCECIGPTEDDVTFKEIDGVLFGTRVMPAPKMIWGNQTPTCQNKLGPSPDRWKIRSKTYQGIADAMADQWGK